MQLLHVKMKQMLLILLMLASPDLLQAQTIPDNFFGVNYWLYYRNDQGQVLDNFKPKIPDMSEGQIKLVRIGGNEINNATKYDLAFHVEAIQNVQSMGSGATPMVQIPINIDRTKMRNEWLPKFAEMGVKYYAIGNEPDPGGNNREWADWYNNGNFGGVPNEKGNDYRSFLQKFRDIAIDIKIFNTTNIIVGPDFRLFYGTETDNNPLSPGNFYENFLNVVGTELRNGVPLLDIFVYHFYYFEQESGLEKRHKMLKNLIDNVNSSPNRAGKPLTIAMGEVNTLHDQNPVPSWFAAGQWLTLNAKLNMKYNGQFVCPWSVREDGMDHSLYDADGTRRSTMEHWALLAKNKRDNFMNGYNNNNYFNDKVVLFGMKDEKGTTVVIMNTSNENINAYSAILNNDPNNFSNEGGNVNVRFRFDSNLGTKWSGTLPAQTTLVYTIDRFGKRLEKYTYSRDMYLNRTPPTKTILNLGGIYYLKNMSSGLYMDVSGPSIDNGANIHQWTFYGTSNQQFEFIPTTDGFYRIEAQNSGKVIDIANISQDNGANVHQWSYGSGDNQQFRPARVGDDVYKLFARHSNKLIEVGGFSTANGGNIQQWADAGQLSGQWELIRVPAVRQAASNNGLSQTMEKQESTVLEGIQLYPNPVENTIYINGTRQYHTIKIFDSVGRLVKGIRKNEQNSIKLDLQGQKTGLYFIKLTNGDKSISYKIIKK